MSNSTTHDYTHCGSAYSTEEWEASARYAEEHASEITRQAEPPAPPAKSDLAQHIFDTMTAQNKALAAYWRGQR